MHTHAPVHSDAAAQKLGWVHEHVKQYAAIDAVVRLLGSGMVCTPGHGCGGRRRVNSDHLDARLLE